MDARTLTRSTLCLLVAALATGCETLRGLRPDPIVPYAPVNTNADPNTVPVGGSVSDAIPGGTVVAAGGASGLTVPQAPPPQGAPGPLAPPRPLPPAPAQGWNGQPPQMMPPPAPPGYGPSPGYAPPPPAGADPHLRVSPTALGGKWQLAPWESPVDRTAELTKQLEAALAQNQFLLTRIKELETLGVSREQALLEAVREIENVTAAGVKERNALMAQLVALQSKIKQLEEEDIVFLRAVIDALTKLLPPEKK